ncbi:MAG: pseudouridine synthase [Desulfuromonadaceae bacterium GWC2_58_13]|nr:MAG: pseudouridine synthase [Desulfuromonadaceae bacterium GWC2_58_13]
MKQRVQKVIANAGLASRRQAEKWIEEGRVRVNGQPVSLGDSADPDTDRIEVNGKPILVEPEKYCILLHKPVGYVTTARDPQGRPVVVDLVKNFPGRLYPVGRLDLNTSGLLLLTNDGELAHHLAHPRHGVEKTYLARVRGAVSPRTVQQLEAGVILDDGLTAPARVEVTRQQGTHSWVKVTIHEGRNRQVRRMFEAVGHVVSRLQRIQFGFLTLENLGPGQHRRLTKEEVERLKQL